MSEIKRYGNYGRDNLGYWYTADAQIETDGEWVLYADHLAAIAAHLAAIAALESCARLEQALLHMLVAFDAPFPGDGCEGDAICEARAALEP